MISPGIIPAAVTPMSPEGHPDFPSMARLLAFFDSAGCSGVVIAGTNGEGPSLSAPEKRDLFRACKPWLGQMQSMLGIATPSLEEAIWLGKQAAKDGADAILVMPPSYFRAAPLSGILDWYIAVMNAVECPLIAYNFPKMTGIEMTPDFVAKLAGHPNFAGLKDSSGGISHLTPMKQAVAARHVLLAGDATPLHEALKAGWRGTISGIANVIPQWQCAVLSEFPSESKNGLVRPIVEQMIAQAQPAMNKALLHRLGIIAHPAVRLPLVEPAREAVDQMLVALEAELGIRLGNLGLVQS